MTYLLNTALKALVNECYANPNLQGKSGKKELVKICTDLISNYGLDIPKNHHSLNILSAEKASKKPLHCHYLVIKYH